MKVLWKVLLGLVLVVPLGGYVAGSLAASASEGQQPRHTIQITEPSRAPTPSARPTGHADQDDDQDDDQNDEVEVIVPEYDDLDDDHGGDRGDHHDGDDHGGDDHGGDDHGGDSDHSGHGGED